MLVPVLDLQVHRLVLLVVGARARDAREDVEGDLAVRLGVLQLGELVRRLGRCVVGGVVLERPGHAALEHIGFKPGVHDASVESQWVVEGGPHVAHLLEFLPYGGFAERVLIVVQEDGALAAIAESRIRGFGGEHAGPHGVMGPLDLGDVDEAGRVADKGSSREGHLGNGLEATLDECAGSVGDALAALENILEQGMRLELLKLAVRREPGVLVVEGNDEAEGNKVLAEVVHEGAAIDVCRQRVAHGVDDQALFEFGGVDLPHLLDAQAVRLVLAVLAQGKLVGDLLGQAAVGALAEHGDAGVKLHAALKRVLGLAAPGYAQVVGRHALDRAVGAVEHLGRREAGVHLDAQFLGPLAQPLDELVEADNVVAVVVHLGRGRDGDRGRLGEEAHPVGAGRGGVLEARRVGLVEPVWDEVVDGRGLDGGARDDVRAQVASLLEHQDAEVVVAGLIGKLLEPDGGAEARGAATHDAHVHLVRLALDGRRVEGVVHLGQP